MEIACLVCDRRFGEMSWPGEAAICVPCYKLLDGRYKQSLRDHITPPYPSEYKRGYIRCEKAGAYAWAISTLTGGKCIQCGKFHL
jgi:hypothetical protein